MASNLLDSKRVLIVDDDPEARDLFSRALAREEYHVESAACAQSALALLHECDFDLVLMDVLMPGVGGLELLRLVRGNERFTNVPVIMISVLDDVESVVTGLSQGANDYITKPINVPILLARVRTQISVGNLIRELERQKEVQARLATFDYLTQIPNRRAFCTMLDAEIYRGRRYGHDLALLMLDIDHFKEVNDTFGHHVGDNVLVEFTRRMSATIRTSDIVGRYGGEEFCIMLPQTSAPAALPLAQRCRVAIEQDVFETEGHRLSITVSGGLVSIVPDEQTTAAGLLEAADKALYRAKANGRNQIQ